MVSGPTSPPKDTGQEEARAPSSLSQTKDYVASFSLASSALPIASFPPTPPSPSFSVEKETNDHAAPLSSVPSSPPFPLSSPFSSFLSYSSCYPSTPSAQMCVHIVVLPGGLIVVFILIRPSPRAPPAAVELLSSFQCGCPRKKTRRSATGIDPY